MEFKLFEIQSHLDNTTLNNMASSIMRCILMQPNFLVQNNLHDTIKIDDNITFKNPILSYYREMNENSTLCFIQDTFIHH